MWKIACSVALLAWAAVVAPATAQETLAPWQLNHFIGQNLFGLGHMNLGVIMSADPQTGVIGLAGRHGEYVLLVSSDLLLQEGLNLWTPNLTPSEIRIGSEETLAHAPRTVVVPEVRVIERPAG